MTYHYVDRRFLATADNGAILTTEQADVENREVATIDAVGENYNAENNVTAGGKYDCRFTGEYRPGQYKREIRLDSEVENWTTVDTNPALPERLIIRIKGYSDAISTNNTTEYGQDFNYRIRIKLKYLVEFKELKQNLRWPVSRQPLSVTINNTLQT